MDISIVIGDVRGPASAADLKDQVTAADGLGVWAAQALGWDALTALVVAGAHAPGIRLGTAVVPVRQRHPLLLAGQALSVQAATGNRLTLGIGAMTAGMFGLPTEQPVRYLREYLSILLPLLRGEPVTHTGRFLTSIGTVELPATAPPPVLLAALGPAMLRLAGSSTDGAITWMTGPRTLESHVVPLIREAAPAPPRIVAGLPVCVTGDEAGARSRITERFGMAGQVPEYRAVLDREGVTGPADVAIVGDEETVARAVRRLEGTGITEFAAAPFGDPIEQRRTTTLLRELASARPVTHSQARRGPNGRRQRTGKGLTPVLCPMQANTARSGPSPAGGQAPNRATPQLWTTRRIDRCHALRNRCAMEECTRGQHTKRVGRHRHVLNPIDERLPSTHDRALLG
ncbi:F420-dependent oxidoreductase-like protein [Actinoplanes campanulatus]|uniref:F420-dependent oxidoreductase-like protein n=1 Tax=Actinoplanes campanulatus TaxID=113559 RepID=A0A7W5FHC6_9ACTN|nr:TIGR03564 family F420-dependent LLM class oxidoreductase [Actinoplanes campanulatus]MBB3098426.1 F420-dependent oxidoreductase-like protein [Actinoplanes campanulatus]GGN35189.1 hypothetical protein GCM10010109_58950 [Actinoplanes campanulatus]GID39119.1 hypothetical protein Aca09nite_56250 [Actinoplanes campanulatus]